MISFFEQNGLLRGYKYLYVSGPNWIGFDRILGLRMGQILTSRLFFFAFYYVWQETMGGVHELNKSRCFVLRKSSRG